MLLHAFDHGSRIKELKMEDLMLIMVFLLLFIIMNIITFITGGADKRLAKSGEYRPAEVPLAALNSFGATPGTMFGFKVFNHKTILGIKGTYGRRCGW